jgi:hypothetical protein
MFLRSAGSLALLLGVACAGSAGDPPGGDPADGGVAEDALAGRDATSPVDAGRADSGGGGAPPWRPFAGDSPWNTPIEENPAIDPNSDALIEALATSSPQWPWLGIAMPQYSIPVYWVDSSAALVDVTVNRLAGEGFRDDPRAPIPPGAMPAAGTDRHMAIVDRAANREWDFWHASFDGANWSCDVCAAIDLSGSGVRPYPQRGSPTWWRSHGSRACGFALTAGLILVEEMQAGAIEHALVLNYPGIRSRWFKPPASTAQATFPAVSPDFGIPCGGRVQLDPAIDVEALSVSESGKIVLRALQKYGAYIGDFGGSITLCAESSPDALAVWQSGLLSVDELRDEFDLRDLRVLELGPLIDDGN